MIISKLKLLGMAVGVFVFGSMAIACPTHAYQQSGNQLLHYEHGFDNQGQQYDHDA